MSPNSRTGRMPMGAGRASRQRKAAPGRKMGGRNNDTLIEALKALMKHADRISTIKEPTGEFKDYYRTLLTTSARLLDYSQSEFAFAIGVDRSTMNRWMRGESVPHPMAASKIASHIKKDLGSRLKAEENRPEKVAAAKEYLRTMEQFRPIASPRLMNAE